MANNIRTCQGSVGRSVRKWESNPYKGEAIMNGIAPKTKTTIVDFDVDDAQMRKHLKKRIEYYKMSGTAIRYTSSMVEGKQVVVVPPRIPDTN